MSDYDKKDVSSADTGRTTKGKQEPATGDNSWSTDASGLYEHRVARLSIARYLCSYWDEEAKKGRNSKNMGQDPEPRSCSHQPCKEKEIPRARRAAPGG